jgi:valyl-tRNA synthetase
MKRMQGLNVLFQGGFDHAGISTQSVVEKELERQGTSRRELGRPGFEARVWEWLREYGGKIMLDFRRMGASMDYRRERFTMDEAYVRASFTSSCISGRWIYRANRIINWCPFHLTSPPISRSTTSRPTTAWGARATRRRRGGRI